MQIAIVLGEVCVAVVAAATQLPDHRAHCPAMVVAPSEPWQGDRHLNGILHSMPATRDAPPRALEWSTGRRPFQLTQHRLAAGPVRWDGDLTSREFSPCAEPPLSSFAADAFVPLCFAVSAAAVAAPEDVTFIAVSDGNSITGTFSFTGDSYRSRACFSISTPSTRSPRRTRCTASSIRMWNRRPFPSPMSMWQRGTTPSTGTVPVRVSSGVPVSAAEAQPRFRSLW